MATGISDVNMLGKLLNWNNAPKTPFFEGQCGEVRKISLKNN